MIMHKGANSQEARNIREGTSWPGVHRVVKMIYRQSKRNRVVKTSGQPRGRQKLGRALDSQEIVARRKPCALMELKGEGVAEEPGGSQVTMAAPKVQEDTGNQENTRVARRVVEQLTRKALSSQEGASDQDGAQIRITWKSPNGVECGKRTLRALIS